MNNSDLNNNVNNNQSSNYIQSQNINIHPITENLNQQVQNINLGSTQNNNINNSPIQSPINESNIQNNLVQPSYNNPNIGSITNTNYQEINQQPPATNVNYQGLNQQSNTTSFDNDELLKSFIGNNYEKITSRPFNFAGFFFTFFYMFYRKMFLYGLILFIIELITVHEIIGFIIAMIINLLIGLFINKLYIHYANKKIKKIKEQNPQKTIDEVKQVCTIKGGTSVGQLILGIFIVGAITFILAILIVITSPLRYFNFKNNHKYIPENNYSENNTYEGVLISDLSAIPADEFSVDIPSVFKTESEDKRAQYDYSYDGNTGEVFDDCEFSLQSVSGYSSSKNLIDQMREFNINNSPTEVKENL